MEINKNWVKKNPFIKFSERFLKKIIYELINLINWNNII